MAKGKSIQAAYSAIAQLRREGRKVTPSAVASLAGIGRSTLYREDADWIEVMAAIEGGELPPSTIVELAPVVPRERLRIAALADRVRLLEEELEETVKVADQTYQRLIDQLQYYFTLSHDTPNRRDETRKLRLELTASREEVNKLRRELNASDGSSNVLNAKGNKRKIEIPAGLSAAKSVDHFLVALHQVIPDSIVGKAFTSIAFVCGLPFSGKTNWIDRQVAPGPGASLFIEGSLHTVEIRELMLRHVRRLCNAEITCVWILADAETCIRRIGSLNVADRALEKLIETIHADTAPVTITEEFDFIVGARG